MVSIWTMWTPWSMHFSSPAVFVPHHHLQGHTKGRCWSVSRCNDSGAGCKFLFQTFWSYLCSLTSQNLAAETAAYLTSKHPDYAVFSACIAISNFHKETKRIFRKLSRIFTNMVRWFISLIVSSCLIVCSVNSENRRAAGMISKETYKVRDSLCSHLQPWL